MKKRISEKQKKFINEYLSNGNNGVRAALIAYETKSYKTASKLACTNLNNPKIAHLIEQVLLKNNISTDTIAEKISDGLKARKLFYDTKTNTFISTKLPDLNIRHKYLSLIIDMLELKRSNKQQVALQGILGIEQIESIRSRVLGN